MRYTTLLLILICVWVIGASSINTSNESSEASSVYVRSLRSTENDLEEIEEHIDTEKSNLRKRRKRAELQTDKNNDDSQEETRTRKRRKNRNRESLIEQDVVIQSDPDSITHSDSEKEVEQAPTIDIRVKEVLIHTVNFTVSVSLPSMVWCKPVKRGDFQPSIRELKKTPGYHIAKEQLLQFENLRSSTYYSVTCYAESLKGTPMSQSLEEVSKSVRTKLNTASFIIPAISVEKEDDRIALHILSEPSKPTFCHLYLMDNQLIDAIPIDLAKWNMTYYFNKIDVYSKYKVSCGLGDNANLQSGSFDYYTGTQFIEPNESSLMGSLIKILIAIVLVGVVGVAGFTYFKKSGYFHHDEEVKEIDPEEETLLKSQSSIPQLSTETTAILNSLQPSSWRCSVCQYLNEEYATECVMCHSSKNEMPSAPVHIEDDEDDEDGFSDFDIQPTNSFTAQAVIPKEPPKIVRVNDTLELSSESEEDSPMPKPSVPVSPPIAVPPVTLMKKEPVKLAAKPIPMKLRTTTNGAPKGTIRIKTNTKSKNTSSVKTKAKPAVIQVSKKSDDLFSELGINAEVKETKRISRVSIPSNKEKKEMVVSDSSEISDNAWDNELDISD